MSDRQPAELERLILEPDETLAVEYKAWLDLTETSHKAMLAKELIALANHGGGHLVIGFSDPGLERLPVPDDYRYPSVDDINGIVERYATPTFHCTVAVVHNHPVIAIPADEKVPIRAKRGAANNEIIQHVYYIRRPGPKSEAPQTGLEWDRLLRRCFDNREDEMEAMVMRVVRVLLEASRELPPEPGDRIDELLNE